MSRRSCMIRVLPAPVRILLIRLGPGWRGGTAGAGWDGGRGAEPLTDGRGAVLVVPGSGAAGSGMTLFPSASGERCRVPATVAIVAGTRQAEGLRGADRCPSGQASAAGRARPDAAIVAARLAVTGGCPGERATALCPPLVSGGGRGSLGSCGRDHVRYGTARV